MARRGQKKLSLQPGNGFATHASFLLSLIPRAAFAHGRAPEMVGATEFGKVPPCPFQARNSPLRSAPVLKPYTKIQPLEDTA